MIQQYNCFFFVLLNLTGHVIELWSKNYDLVVVVVKRIGNFVDDSKFAASASQNGAQLSWRRGEFIPGGFRLIERK